MFLVMCLIMPFSLGVYYNAELATCPPLPTVNRLTENLVKTHVFSELEDAEGRADQAESSLHLIRAKHRSSVVTGKGASPKVYVLEDDA